MKVSLLPSTRMRGNGLASKKVQIRYYKTNFTERVVSHWTKLPRQVVELPAALESFKSSGCGIWGYGLGVMRVVLG